MSDFKPLIDNIEGRLRKAAFPGWTVRVVSCEVGKVGCLAIGVKAIHEPSDTTYGKLHSYDRMQTPEIVRTGELPDDEMELMIRRMVDTLKRHEENPPAPSPPAGG